MFYKTFCNYCKKIFFKVFNKDNNRKYFYLLFALGFFILFKKKIDQLMLTLLVKPILSFVFPASLIYDVIIIIGFFAILFYFINKIRKGIQLPSYWFLICLFFLIVYFFYRVQNYPFSFTSFYFMKSVKLLDALILLPFVINTFSLFAKGKDNVKIINDSGFIPDEPLILNEKNDLLNRMRFINELATVIKNTRLDSSSFSVGLVSPWGNGKTTFLRCLKKQFNQEKFLIIDLDVWKCKSTEVIIQTFFQLLKSALRPYSFSIDNQIKNYSYSLLKESKNDFTKSIFEIFSSNKNIEKQYDEINNEIIKINKKILVFIDDIDRLNKEEIFEIVRLIRNTANFYNTFFIVAYDKSYLLNAIEKINSYHPNLFLEKIFQIEFVLPPVDKTSLDILLASEIKKILTENGKMQFENFLKPGLTFSYTKTDLTSLFINNIRDVKRFVNSFKINYQFIKDEMFFSDFYNLELIKFKHPEIFMEFYKNKNAMLVSDSRRNVHPQIFTYRLVKVPQDVTDSSKQDFKFKIFLKGQQDIYKVNDNEIELIVKSFASIFSEPDFDISYEEKTSFSVIIPSMFDRYFKLNIQGKLSDVEFSTARNSSIEFFLDQIDKWNTDANLMAEVIDTFESIKDYDNKGDFEKIIIAMFHLGRTTNYQVYKNLYEKIQNYDDRITSKYYGHKNGKKEYQEFIKSFFTLAKDPYLFESNFVSYIKSTYYDESSFILSLKELNTNGVQYFKEYCLEHNKIDGNFWRLFWNSEEVEKISEGNTIKSKKSISDEVIILVKECISKKDLNGFLQATTHPAPFNSNSFGISDAVLAIFKSWDSFESFLNEQDEKKWSYLTEFKQFFHKMKEQDFKKYVEFTFKIIPIDKT